MLKEKKSIITIRCICFAILLIIIATPFLVYLIDDIKIVDSKLDVKYDSVNNISFCDANFTFNKNIYSLDLNIAILDSNSQKLDVITQEFNKVNDKNINLSFTINGNASTLEINQCQLFSTFCYVFFFSAPFCLVIALIFVIESLHLNYKVYKINKNKIIIYGGFYKNYLKFNGEIVDSHNFLISFKKIKLNYALNNENKDTFTATISLSKRIKLYKNNQLVPYIKSKLFNN